MAKSKQSTLSSNGNLAGNAMFRPVIESASLKTSSPQPTKVSQRLLVEVAKSISNIRGWGSVEIFIQDHKVTQITERNINKTDALLLTDDRTS